MNHSSLSLLVVHENWVRSENKYTTNSEMDVRKFNSKISGLWNPGDIFRQCSQVFDEVTETSCSKSVLSVAKTSTRSNTISHTHTQAELYQIRLIINKQEC